ncbi:hypothetical protein [Bradyrhizobium sp. 63_E2_N1_3]|uniref:hypothetical protein n=1 Tax=Bradyrhizobium sp. 63_E2_N1_3 TaxID=3240373 RepID=UPI003F8C28DD
MPAHANDNSHHTAPIITRLRRAGRRDDLANLLSYDRPVQTDLYPDNDNQLSRDMGVDSVHEIRPTPGEIARAGIDGLRFNKKGQITHWRRADSAGNPVLDKNGREQWFEAFERYAQPKGKRRKTRAEQDEEGAAYLAIPATGSFPERSRYVERGSSGEDYRRQCAAKWVDAMGEFCDTRRREIDRMGLGGGKSFEEAWASAGLYPACRLPQYQTGIAMGVNWLGGKTRRNARATPGSFVGAPDAAENANVAAMDAPKMDAALGDHVAVLHEALDGMSARQIASKRGWGNSKGAEQRAVRAQDRALAALAEVQKQAA